MNLDKEKIRQIALMYFQSKSYVSTYDCWTEALETYLNQEGLEIVKKPDENLGGVHPAEQKN